MGGCCPEIPFLERIEKPVGENGPPLRKWSLFMAGRCNSENHVHSKVDPLGTHTLHSPPPLELVEEPGAVLGFGF